MSRLKRRYLRGRECKGYVSRRNPRDACSELPCSLRPGCHRPGTRRSCRPWVTGGQAVCAAPESGQTDRSGYSHELRLRGPVRSRHQAARLRRIRTGEVDCRQNLTRCSLTQCSLTQCSPRGSRVELDQFGYARSRDRATRRELARLLGGRRIAADAAGWCGRNPDSRRVRRNARAP
jgi:hypothetical protein